jgi:hypothetical protein
MTVVLAYPAQTRHIAVDLACPTVTLQNGASRYLLGHNAQTVVSAYDATGRGHKSIRR